MNNQLILVRQPSGLHTDAAGMLPLRLVQSSAGENSMGIRQQPQTFQRNDSCTPEQADACAKLLDDSRIGGLTVMAFRRGLRACEAQLERLAETRSLVALAGIGEDHRNITLVATCGRLHRSAKISLATEDIGVRAGNELNVYVSQDGADASAVSWAVLNCHDYTHVDILDALLKEKIEVLVVVSHNSATRLYWQYAIADVHRLYCYVVIVNIAEQGGSGVFAPIRRLRGDKNAQFGAGGQIFATKGPGEFVVDFQLDVGNLRQLRQKFAAEGFAALDKDNGGDAPMVPPENFMHTFDRLPAEPAMACTVREIPTEWRGEKFRVATAQLDHIGLSAYIANKYRIRDDAASAGFLVQLRNKLEALESKCRATAERDGGAALDLLVLPEVFVPRTFLPQLQLFSDRLGATVVAGIDYPDGDESTNANECVILRPAQKQEVYRKITRSQYDAQSHGGGRMPLNRGSELLRFVNDEKRGFGILVCYDFSHLDLMRKINLEKRKAPLDLVVVIAHNPFGDLYRSCCVADAHRFYQYVVMCNVSDYGGSGVFAPIRTPGARHVLAEAGKNFEGMSLIELDLAGLEEARRTEDDKLHGGKFMRKPGIFQRRLSSIRTGP
ncbi:MAG: hypothetical protein V4684_04085 [Pseudomonadota bacterium]